MLLLLGRRTVDNRAQRSLGDSRVRISLNKRQHGGVEIKDLEYLGDTGARNAQAVREFSFGFTALLHGASPFARAAYRIGTPALARRGWPQWFRWLIPGETVTTLTVDSLPAAIKVKGDIEFEAVRKITRFGEPLFLAEPSPGMPLS
jgi:hypothetical protein